MKKKKFIISLIGRFIFFDIAEELHNHNELVRLYSSYPKFFFKKDYTISKKKIRSFMQQSTTYMAPRVRF